MSCQDAEYLRAFVAGGLEPTAAQSMRVHIEECEVCFVQVASLAAAISQELALGGSLSGVTRPESLQASSFVIHGSGPSSHAEPTVRTELPQTIGPYQIEALVGAGGMGTVYRGFSADGVRVAVKTVRTPTRSLFESLRQEIQLLSQTRHPRIARVLDYDLTGGDPWYAMELVAGETLSNYLNALWPGPPVSESPAANGRLLEIVELFAKLCEPLAFLHDAGIVHSDLKPSNILLRSGNDPVLMDFGLVTYARGAVDREALSAVTGPRGTVMYLSPEVLRGGVPDPRTDLYALGCMLYEAVAGRPPFIGARSEIARARLSREAEPASQLVRGVPPELDALLGKLLASDLRNRPGHALDVERELLAVVGGSQVERGRRGALSRPQLVGRAEPLARLEGCVARLRERSGGIVLVAGESGIGKTFVALEAARLAVGRGVKVIVGECTPPAPASESGLATATSALSPLRAYFEFLRDCSREGGAEAAERLLGGALPTLAPYSPALASLRDQVRIPELSKLPQDAGRERLLAALTQTLVAVTSQAPLMLVLDDVQWADELTLALFETLRSMYLDRLPLLIVATYRSEDQVDAVLELAAKPHVVTLRLDPLQRRDVAAMVRDMVGPAEPEPALVDFVYSHAEGVPFFTAEYLRSLVGEGLLARTSDGWRLSNGDTMGALASLPLPVRLAEVIRRRVGGLADEALRAVQAGAALGREFEVAVLADMLELSVEAAQQRLEEARARQLILESSERSLRFAHDKFRETIYAELTNSQRHAFHGAAARALVQRFKDPAELEYRYGEIARHLRLADQSTTAIDYLEKAAERALRISADAEALRFLKEVLQLEEALPERVSPLRRAMWERGVAEALHGLGRLAESAAPLARAAKLLGHPIPAAPRDLGLAIGWHLVRRALPTHFLRAKRDDSAASREMGRVLERVLRISYYTGNNLQLLYACVASLTFCEDAGPSSDLATAYSNAGATAGIVPAHQLASRYFERAARLLEAHASPAELSQLCMLRGSYYMGIGSQKAAIQTTESGIAVAREIGFHRREDECTAIRSAIDLHAGRHREIEQRSRRIELSARRRGDAQMLSWALLQRLECMVMRGELDAALALLADVWPLLARSERAEKIWILGFAAYTYFRVGQIATSLEHADRAAALVKEGALVQSYCANSLDRLAELRVLRWRQSGHSLRGGGGQLERDAAAACRSQAAVARIFPFARPGSRLQRGLLCWGRGEKRSALRHWNRGIVEARQMGLVYHEARLLAALSSASSEEGGREAGKRSLELLQALELDERTLTVRAAVEGAG